MSCSDGISTKWIPVHRASMRIDITMPIDRPPSMSSVVAAFLLFGLRKAGTPLLMASTPVSAAQPEANARSTRKPPAIPISPCSKPGSASIS